MTCYGAFISRATWACISVYVLSIEGRLIVYLVVCISATACHVQCMAQRLE